MAFTPLNAADYRGMDYDAFVVRKKEIEGLLKADALPEGVTDEMLFAEADLIEADAQRRTRANKLFNQKIEAVAAGAGTVIASDEAEEVRAMPKAEAPKGEFRARNRETSQRYTDTAEYREAFAKHVAQRAPMPNDMLAKAYQERSNDTVSLNAGFSNFTDPTFSNTYSTLVIAPSTLSDEVLREVRELSVLFPKVTQTSYQGQYAVSELDLQLTGAWIGDKETSPWQGEYDPEVFTWAWHQFEARFARTMLVQAVMDAKYDQVSSALAEVYANAMDAAVLAGNGTTQPRGISNDVRLVGSDGNGKTTTGTPTTVGKALVIEVTAEDIDSWVFWSTLLYNTNFNRSYRGKGELILADGTWGNHVAVLRDDNNRPICLADPLNDEPRLSLRGVGPVDTLPNGIMPAFDNASTGDVIGIYGNFRNYVMNTQPGMPLSTVSWTDHDRNLEKTKMLVACDGRVANPFGWVILKKAASA